MHPFGVEGFESLDVVGSRSFVAGGTAVRAGVMAMNRSLIALVNKVIDRGELVACRAARHVQLCDVCAQRRIFLERVA